MSSALAAVEPLPRPGLLSGLMDGQPWLISALLFGAGIAAFVMLRNQDRLRAGTFWLLGLVLAAAALNIAAALVITDRERMAQATLELVRMTARADTGALDPMLAPEVRLIAAGRIREVVIPREGWEKTEILDQVQKTLGGAYTPEEYAVLQTQAQRLGPSTGRTQVRIRVTLGGYPTISWWRIDWRRDSAGTWRAILIEFLELDRF